VERVTWRGEGENYYTVQVWSGHSALRRPVEGVPATRVFRKTTNTEGETERSKQLTMRAKEHELHMSGVQKNEVTIVSRSSGHYEHNAFHVPFRPGNQP